MPTTSQSLRDRSAPACLSPPHAPRHPLSNRLRALRRRCTRAESSPLITTTPAPLPIAPRTSRTMFHASSGRLIMTSWPSPWTPTTCTASKAQVQTQAVSALWAQPCQKKTSATTLCATGDPNLRALESCTEGLRWALQTQMSCRATSTPGVGALSSYTNSAKAIKTTACRVCVLFTEQRHVTWNESLLFLDCQKSFKRKRNLETGEQACFIYWVYSMWTVSAVFILSLTEVFTEGTKPHLFH